MFDRFDFRRRSSLREIESDFSFDTGAVHIEELAVDHHDPFHDHPRQENRWLLTTCLAGLAGSVIVGGTLVGLFGYVFPRDVSEVAFNTIFWQQSSSTRKGDFVGATASVGRGSVDPLYRRITASYDPREQEIPIARTVLTARNFSGNALSASYPSVTDDVLPYGAHTRPAKYNNAPIRTASLTPDNVTTVLKAVQPDADEKQLVFEKGDSLTGLLTSAGATPEAAKAMSAAVELVFPAKRLTDGQEFNLTVEYRPDFYGKYVPYPARLIFSPAPGEQVVVEADNRGRYLARIDGESGDPKSLLANLPYSLVKAKVDATLYNSAKSEGVPQHIIAELMRVHSYDVDFERDVQPGDSFEVFFGKAPDNSNAKRKVLLYSALTLEGKRTGYYRFTSPEDGITDYYDGDGQSVRKALLRTPISGARTSSGFGMRRHPIIGYTKMHAGIDFAAPTGTPIKAAGDGVIEHAGRFGAYGNYVRVRHSSPYKTAYAHMSRIARGVQPGTKVRQGQVIGYVGTTGRSTGPHLHYEIMVNDQKVNPSKVRIDNGRKLAGAELKQFLAQVEKVKAMMRAVPTSTQVAGVESSVPGRGLR